MKFSAVRNPNDRCLMDLVLLFIPLDGSVGDTALGPTQNLIEMPTQHAYEFLEGIQSGAHGRTHRFLQMVAGPRGLLVKQNS
jgi:hypothetical protein